MMITHLKNALKLESARAQPYLPMLSFDIQLLCDDVLKSCFPDIDKPINIHFCKNDSLACICTHDDYAEIFIHVLLNDASTPWQVCRDIIAHELVHLVVPPEIIDGRRISHGVAFRQREKQVAPDISLTWSWIYLNFLPCLHIDKDNERTLVTKAWKKAWGGQRYSWESSIHSVKDCDLYV